jgi:hypothetical protein
VANQKPDAVAAYAANLDSDIANREIKTEASW